MELFENALEFDEYGSDLGVLLLIGRAALRAEFRDRQKIRRTCWLDAVQRAAVQREVSVAPKQLNWLWNALRFEPEESDTFGHHMVDDRDWTKSRVLPAGSRLRIELHQNLKDPTGADRADVYAILNEDLFMGKGKSGHLECKASRVTLVMRIPIGLKDSQTEADSLNVDEDRIHIAGDILSVCVSSLNEAYMRASLRLEPKRRAYGGRIYSALYWEPPSGSPIRLKEVRLQVELGIWKCPQS